MGTKSPLLGVWAPQYQQLDRTPYIRIHDLGNYRSYTGYIGRRPLCEFSDGYRSDY